MKVNELYVLKQDDESPSYCADANGTHDELPLALAFESESAANTFNGELPAEAPKYNPVQLLSLLTV